MRFSDGMPASDTSVTAAQLLARFYDIAITQRDVRRRMPIGDPLIVRDASLPGRPVRSLTVRADGSAVVETIRREPRPLDLIALTSPDADQRLAKYTRVPEP